jgi:hypothetical protein
MDRYLMIPIQTKYDDDGNPVEYIAHVESRSGKSAAGIGITPLEAVRNLVNAQGPVTAFAVEEWIVEKLGGAEGSGRDTDG